MLRYTFAIACLVTLFMCGDSFAQRYTPGYLSRPTLSPYLNLFRGDGGGGLNNYFTFVRPQLRMERFIQNATRQVELNTIATRMEEQRLRQTLLPESPTSTLQQRPTSDTTLRRSAGRFMSFGRFYPSNNTPLGTTRRR